MQGGVVGDPAQPENLVQTQPKQDLQRRLLGPTYGLASDQPVERGPPANDAINQLLAQPPIRGAQRGPAQRFREEAFDESGGAARQDLRRNFSWFLGAHIL